jgi:hypothetical protein
MFDVLFIYYTVVCVSGLPLIQTRRRRIILKTFKGKTLSSLSSKTSVLDACCTYFLYLSIGLHASNFCQNCGNTYVSYLSMYYPFYQDLGRILVTLYVMLSLPSLGLTMRIG